MHRFSDFVDVCFEREMAGIEELDCGIGIVFAVCVGARFLQVVATAGTGRGRD